MQSTIYRCLGLLMVMALAACGNSGGALPTSASISNDTNTNPTADSNSGQSAPASEDLEFLHYTVKLTGAETANAEGNLQIIFIDEAGRLISFAGPGMNFQAIIQTPETVQVGEHDLTVSGDYSAQISTSYEASGTYDANVSGKLNITSADPLQGTYEYSASNEAGDTVTASGSFDEVPYSFAMKVTGAVEANVPAAGSGQVMTTTLGDEDVLIIDTSNPADIIAQGHVFTVSFYMPTDIAAGEYGLTAIYPTPAEGEVGVMISDDDETSTTFDTNIKGTLTLTEVGAQYSGTYTITAESTDGKTVTVEGSFTDVPVIEAVDL